MDNKNRKVLIVSIILSLALGFWGGFWLRPESANNSLKEIKKLINLEAGKPSEVDFSLFWKVYSDLQEKYVNSKKLQEEISGSFGGVGIEIGKRNDILTVIAPLKDTPAYKAGIKAGDKILKIDNKPTDNISIEEAVNLIRGKKGTKVVLTINNGATKDVELIREIG